MKNDIMLLRSQGLSYRAICDRLGCSKSTVAFHCGEGQKEKNRRRTQNRRKTTVISQRVEDFQYKKLRGRTEDFQRERLLGGNKLGKRRMTFGWKDVIDKFGWFPTCYLTGRKIDLREAKTYEFDHKVPYAKSGESTIENLGIVCKQANRMKHDMTVVELVDMCREILEHQGYDVRAK